MDQAAGLPEPRDLRGSIYPIVGIPAAESSLLVYLSPGIESFNHKRVNYVVAHEFLHVLLHPFNTGQCTTSEQEPEADAKIKEWGFQAAYRVDEYPH